MFSFTGSDGLYVLPPTGFAAANRTAATPAPGRAPVIPIPGSNHWSRAWPSSFGPQSASAPETAYTDGSSPTLLVVRTETATVSTSPRSIPAMAGVQPA